MKITRVHVLFSLILLLGVFARVWEFPAVPAGLNADETSSGVDAYNLAHYGVDTNGQSFPVHAIAYGSGQNIPYTYLIMPFVLLGGLSPLTVRLPMLILGILSLPLIFYIGRRTFDDTFGLLAMFFMAVCPWHVTVSRWGLDSNILPFIFLAAFVFLIKTGLQNKWFLLACFFFGLCFYAYGTANVVVPIVVLCASVLLIVSRRLDYRTLILGWAILFLTALPIGLFLMVNTFKWEPIHLGLVTIPRLPGIARFQSIVAFNDPHVLSTLKKNAYAFFGLLWSQDDEHYFNVVGNNGYFYTYTLPLALVGALGLLPFFKNGQKVEKLLLLTWLLACLPLGILERVTINRINILFIPLVMCMAVPLTWLKGRLRLLDWLVVAVLLVAFAGFTRDYHSDWYAYIVGRSFNAGIIPALESADSAGNGPICVTDKAAEPYIYVLFVTHLSPADFLAGARFEDPHADYRFVNSFGRYTFRLRNCPRDPQTVYVLGEGEQPPDKTIPYRVETFTNFKVYKP